MGKERLISANELYRLIEEEFDGVCVYDVTPSEAVYDFQSIVDRATTVDAEPVKHGMWIGLEYDGYADGNPVYDLWECSHCNCEWDGEEDTLPNYCPDCGAKMDLKVDPEIEKSEEDHIQKQIESDNDNDYLDCHDCKHKGHDNYVCAHLLACMRAYGIYTKKDNEDMEGEYGWPKLDYFERL